MLGMKLRQIQMSRTRTHVAMSALAAVLAVGAMSIGSSAPSIAAKAISAPPVFTTTKEKLALNGYDPVAYFVAGGPKKGLAAITAQHQGATWRFESEANKTSFLAQPEKYAPQYGGYCAYAVSQGYTASADPTAWEIVDGKLYVNYNRSVAASWSKQSRAYITSGDDHWAKRTRVEANTN